MAGMFHCRAIFCPRLCAASGKLTTPVDRTGNWAAIPTYRVVCVPLPLASHHFSFFRPSRNLSCGFWCDDALGPYRPQKQNLLVVPRTDLFGFSPSFMSFFSFLKLHARFFSFRKFLGPSLTFPPPGPTPSHAGLSPLFPAWLLKFSPVFLLFKICPP